MLKLKQKVCLARAFIRGKNKVARNEESKFGFSYRFYTWNMANFEAFYQVISSSINLLNSEEWLHRQAAWQELANSIWLSQKWAYFNCKLMLQKLHFVLKSFPQELDLPVLQQCRNPNTTTLRHYNTATLRHNTTTLAFFRETAKIKEFGTFFRKLSIWWLGTHN